ncbi:hypothetical protein CHH28_05895 [Bacterioplanes sanyensis]|uniref:Uncharacterized protein n=1 Tax=Bacterioplanes sanyensis TaxID=1249553 RepID=A0A222FHJ7_9GAMM|nr:hypothetical protein [Bacterioplanes sanyensis]ASP38239.1 hypothetical protein CHH28_05895 [Bacterioplanes sanyensis]
MITTFHRQLIVLTALSLPTLWLSGCSSQPDIPVHEVEYQRYLDENTQAVQRQQQQALDTAEQALKQSEAQRLSFFSPGYAQQLEQAVSASRQASLTGEHQTLINKANEASNLLELALANKKQVEKLFENVLQRLAQVRELQADKVQRRQYQQFLQNLQTHFLALEAQQSPTETELNALLIQLEQLQRSTLLARYWQPAHSTLEQAASEGAAAAAAQTYQRASALVDDTGSYIQLQQGDPQEAARKGLEALRHAQQALFVSREAKRLQNLNPSQAEQAVLRFEQLLHQISQGLDGKDRRHMSLQDQMLSIKQRLDELQRQTTPSAAVPPAPAASSTPSNNAGEQSAP